MSITVSTCQEINRSPVNNSKAKMLYSFSRSQRFPKRRRILCDKFYGLSSSVSPTRTTTFGFGNKYQFTKNVPKNPAPNTYNLHSDFQCNKKKGFGFGEGRAEMELTGPLVDAIKNKNPGPNVYKIESTLNKSSYSIGIKWNEQNKQKKLIPGPGTYGVSFPISSNGSYYLAKHKNSLARNFSKLENRPLTVDNKVPGPGSYDLKSQLFTSDGKYITSKMHNSLVRRFGKSIRTNIQKKNNTPGPGNYKLPSQFGHYVSKQTYKSQRNSFDHQNKQNAA